MNKETARQRLEDMTKSFLEKIPEDNNLMRRELQTWMDGAKIHLDVIYDKKNAEISDDFRVIKEYSKKVPGPELK